MILSSNKICIPNNPHFNPLLECLSIEFCAFYYIIPCEFGFKMAVGPEEISDPHQDHSDWLHLTEVIGPSHVKTLCEVSNVSLRFIIFLTATHTFAIFSSR